MSCQLTIRQVKTFEGDSESHSAGDDSDQDFEIRSIWRNCLTHSHISACLKLEANVMVSCWCKSPYEYEICWEISLVLSFFASTLHSFSFHAYVICMLNFATNLFERVCCQKHLYIPNFFIMKPFDLSDFKLWIKSFQSRSQPASVIWALRNSFKPSCWEAYFIFM